MESAHRTSLAKGEVGIRDKKPVLTLAQFISERLEPWAKTKPAWIWYRSGIRPLLDCREISRTSIENCAFCAEHCVWVWSGE